MKIEQSQITKLFLTEVSNLDPITVFLEDLEPRKGKITIDCYGKSWTAYWGGMGSSNIAQFFVSCDNGYLAGNLSDLRQLVEDKDNRPEWVRAGIIKLRRESFPDLTKEEARDLWDEAEDLTPDSNLWSHSDLLVKVFGDEWFMYALPEKPNHEYQYLCRIIDAVRDGLKEYLS